MAKKNLEMGRSANRFSKHFKTISPTPSKNETWASPRLSPVSSPPIGCQVPSPRTSPGLLAGHYAGCKFTEPPLPSALPPPPQHWMQTSQMRAYTAVEKTEQPLDISHQLKVLLKVQA